MKKKYLLLAVAMIVTSLGFSQKKDGLAKSGDGPVNIQQPKNFFVTKPMRDYPQVLDKSIFDNKIVPKGGINTSEDLLSPKRQNKLNWIKSAGESPTSVDPLAQGNIAPLHDSRAPIVNFETSLVNASPPDPSMAVGPNHVVTMENGLWSVYDKTGVQAPGFPKQLNNPLTAPGATANSGDPVVVYDRNADRWFITQFQLPSGNDFLIGVSQTPDPTGAYYVYHYALPSGNDYPHYGIWGDSFVTAGNFTGSKIRTWNRTKMLAGDATAEMAEFAPAGLGGSGFTAPMPIHSEGLGDATGPIKVVYYQDDAFAGITSDHVGLWNIDMDWSNIPGSTISAKQEIGVSAFDAIFTGGFANIAQPGTGQRIDVIMGAIMNMAHWYKFPTYETMIMNWPVEVTNGSLISGIRWVELRSTDGGTSWSVYQEGTFTDPTGAESVFMGCMSMDIQGNIGLGYTKSGTTTFPSLYYSGRLSTDALGTMPVAEQLVVAGTNSVTTNDRYGDYGQAVRDPNDDITFWVTSEYDGSTPIRRTRVYSFQLAVSFTNDVGVSAIITPSTAAGLTATETVQVTLENFGTVAQSNIPVELKVGGVTVATETYVPSLAAGASTTFTFAQTVDLSTVSQTYALEACTTLGTDEFAPNDCATKSVSHLLGNDVGVISISSPNSGTGLTAAETVTITVENFGGNAQSNIPVQYTINGGAAVNGTVPGPIASGATEVFNFPTTADLSALGSYTFCAKTNLVGDQDTTNDESCKAVNHIGCTPAATAGCNADGIKQFVLGTINVDDGGAGCNTTGAVNGYVDRMDLSTDLDRAAGLNVHTLQAWTLWDGPPAGAEKLSVWIDFNDNGVFEGSEQLISGGTYANGTASLSDFTLTIPVTAALGTHVLRARGIDTTGAPGDVNDPCADMEFGETHDYTVNIIDSVLSVEDDVINESSFNVNYLNGNVYQVELNANQSIGDLNLTVYNAVGQRVITTPVSYGNGKYAYTLNLSSQASGVYLVNIGNDKTSKTKKIVVR